jgi:protein involved in polysaccharide export with SLBB domain
MPVRCSNRRESRRSGTLRAWTPIAVFLIALASSTAGAQQRAAEPSAPAAAALRPGDRLRVQIFREPELSREYQVPVDGVVDFPIVGGVNVVRVTTDSLTSELRARYAVSLRDPSIEVTPLRRVRVFGAVRNPGYYHADPTVTVAGAILLAGGITSEGTAARVQLLRSGQRRTLARTGGAFRTDLPVASGDEISVPERSWVSRNTALLASVVTGLALVVAAVVR